MIESPLPLLGFAAYSGTGKTTLLKQLLPWLKNHQLRIGIIKHAHHRFEIDYPGKDSFELREAGAEQLLIASDRMSALIRKPPVEKEPELEELLQQLDTSELDLILVEGFKHAAFAKIELHRPSLGKPLLFPDDPHVIAVACDEPLPVPCDLPQFDLSQVETIGAFILSFCQSQATGKAYVRASA